MDADAGTLQGMHTMIGSETETPEREYATRLLGNIMDVLMPATPPEPKNVRVVRQFDVEAAKADSVPAEIADVKPAGVQHSAQRRLSRREVRALRNRSLRAAAGLD